MKNVIYSVALLALMSGSSAAASKAGATAELKDAQGKAVGKAQLKQVKNGVQIALRVHDLPAGIHAFHIHSVGQCEPPKFDSAGKHFNPENKKHGMKNPEGPHAGDLPNITVSAKGQGKARIVNHHFTLGEGASSLFQPGGTSIVIHEKADDEKTDPAGNAGARIACGVIQKTP